MLAPEPALELIGIVGVPPRDLTIQHQAGGGPGQKQLVPEERFPALLFDDVRVLFKQGEDLFVGRNRFLPQDSTLGLSDDPGRQGRVMA